MFLKNYKNLYIDQLEENKKLKNKIDKLIDEINETKKLLKESKNRKKMQQLIEERNYYMGYVKRTEEKLIAYEKIYGKGDEKNE